MTTTTAPTAPVRLHDHWRDAARVEADDASTLARGAAVLVAAGYHLAEPPHGAGRCGGPAFWFDDFDVFTLQKMLIRNGIPAVIASTTTPTPAEAAEDEAAWQLEMAEMESEAQAAVEAEAQQPAPADGAPS